MVSRESKMKLKIQSKEADANANQDYQSGEMVHKSSTGFRSAQPSRLRMQAQLASYDRRVMDKEEEDKKHFFDLNTFAKNRNASNQNSQRQVAKVMSQDNGGSALEDDFSAISHNMKKSRM